MNEEALQASFEIFKKGGYKGSIEDYKLLMSTNKEALNISFEMFKKGGYSKKIDDFSTLIGVGKQSDPLYGVTDGSQWLNPPAPGSEADSPSTQPSFWEKGIEASLLIENDQWAKIIGDDPENSGVPDLIWRGVEDESSHIQQIQAREKLDNPNVLEFPMPTIGSIEDENHPNNLEEFQALETPAERYHFLVDYEDGAYLGGSNFTSETLPSQIAKGQMYFDMKERFDLLEAVDKQDSEAASAVTTDRPWWEEHFKETGRKKADYKKVTSSTVGNNYYFINKKGESEWVDDETFMKLEGETKAAETEKERARGQRKTEKQEKDDNWDGNFYSLNSVEDVVIDTTDDGEEIMGKKYNTTGHVTPEDFVSWFSANMDEGSEESLNTAVRNLNRKYKDTHFTFSGKDNYITVHNNSNGKRKRISALDANTLANGIQGFINESDLYKYDINGALRSPSDVPEGKINSIDDEAVSDFEANKKVSKLTGGNINEFGEMVGPENYGVNVIFLGEQGHESVASENSSELVRAFLGPYMDGTLDETAWASTTQAGWEVFTGIKNMVTSRGKRPSEYTELEAAEYLLTDQRDALNEAGGENKSTLQGQQLLDLTQSVHDFMLNEVLRMRQPGAFLEINEKDKEAIYERAFQALNRQEFTPGWVGLPSAFRGTSFGGAENGILMTREDFGILTGGAMGREHNGARVGMLESIIQTAADNHIATTKPSEFDLNSEDLYGRISTHNEMFRASESSSDMQAKFDMMYRVVGTLEEPGPLVQRAQLEREQKRLEQDFNNAETDDERNDIIKKNEDLKEQIKELTASIEYEAKGFEDWKAVIEENAPWYAIAGAGTYSVDELTSTLMDLDSGLTQENARLRAEAISNFNANLRTNNILTEVLGDDGEVTYKITDVEAGLEFQGQLMQDFMNMEKRVWQDPEMTVQIDLDKLWRDIDTRQGSITGTLTQGANLNLLADILSDWEVEGTLFREAKKVEGKTPAVNYGLITEAEMKDMIANGEKLTVPIGWLRQNDYDVRDFESWYDSGYEFMSEDHVLRLGRVESAMNNTKAELDHITAQLYYNLDPKDVTVGTTRAEGFFPTLAKGSLDFVDETVGEVQRRWFDYSEDEVARDRGRGTGSSVRNQALIGTIQEGAQNFNALNEQNIKEGKVNPVTFTKEQQDNFEMTIMDETIKMAGGFVPMMLELEAISVATGGVGGFTGITRFAKAMRKGNLWKRGTELLMFMAWEEAKMQAVGFKQGSGASFALTGRMLPGVLGRIPILRLPVIQKTLGAGIGGGISMGVAHRTEMLIDDWEGRMALEYHHMWKGLDEEVREFAMNTMTFGFFGAKGLRRSKWRNNLEYSALGRSMNGVYYTKLKQNLEGKSRDIFRTDADKAAMEELEAQEKENERRRKKDKSYTEKEYQETKKRIQSERAKLNETNKDGTLKRGKSSEELTKKEKQQLEDYAELLKTARSYIFFNTMNQKLSPWTYNEKGEQIKNPKFEESFNKMVLDPVNGLLKAVNGKNHVPITVEFIDSSTAEGRARRLSSDVKTRERFLEKDEIARFDAANNKLIFDLNKYQKSGQRFSQVNVHELVHASLRQVFKNDVRQEIIFQDKLQKAFKDAYGTSLEDLLSMTEGKLKREYKRKPFEFEFKEDGKTLKSDRELTPKERELRDKDKQKHEELLREEFLSNLAEFVTNPEIYYSKVNNTFMKNARNVVYDYLEEFTLPGSKVPLLRHMFKPEGGKEMIQFLGRLGDSARRGRSIKGKLLALSEMSWTEIEHRDMEFNRYAAKETKGTRDLSKEKASLQVETQKLEKDIQTLSENFKRTNLELVKNKQMGKAKENTVKFKEQKQALEAKVESTKEKLKNVEALEKKTYEAEIDAQQYKQAIEQGNENTPENQALFQKLLKTHEGYIGDVKKLHRKDLEDLTGVTKDAYDLGVEVEVKGIFEAWDPARSSFAARLRSLLALRSKKIFREEQTKSREEQSVRKVELDNFENNRFEVADSNTRDYQELEAAGGKGMRGALEGKQYVRASRDGKRIIPADAKFLTEADINKVVESIKELDLADPNFDISKMPNLVEPMIERYSNPPTPKSAKDGAKKRFGDGSDYGTANQKKANFIANHQENIDASMRQNTQAETTGKATGVRTTLQSRKRPGAESATAVFYEDLVVDGKKVRAGFSETGEWVRGDKVKGTGNKAGNIVKKRVLEGIQNRDAYLKEIGIVDNRLPEADFAGKKVNVREKAIEISEKPTDKMTAGDIQFMKEYGNVNIDAMVEKIPGKNQFKDPALQRISQELLNEYGVAITTQIADLYMQQSPKFKTMQDAQKIIEKVTSGKSKRLAAMEKDITSFEKNLGKEFNLPFKEAREHFKSWVLRDFKEIPKNMLGFLNDTFGKSNLRNSMLNYFEHIVDVAAENKIYSSVKNIAKELPKIIQKQGGQLSIRAEQLGIKGIDGKKLGDTLHKAWESVGNEGAYYSKPAGRVIKYEIIEEHVDGMVEMIKRMPKQFGKAQLTALAGDVMSSRTGKRTFVNAFKAKFSELEPFITNEKGEKVKNPEHDKKNTAGKIIDNWENGKSVKPEYKEWLDKLENQHTDLFREVNGELVEVPYSDPVFKKIKDALKEAGTNLDPAWKDVSVEFIESASKEGKIYGDAMELMYEGKTAEAMELIEKSFTPKSENARAESYQAKGQMEMNYISEAKTEAELVKRLKFLARVARSNTNLTEGDRALMRKTAFWVGDRAAVNELKTQLAAEGIKPEKAEKLANTAKIEHAKTSLKASFQKYLSTAIGDWGTKGRQLAKDYIGVFAPEAALEIVDIRGTKTNTAGLARFAKLRAGLKNVMEFNSETGKFTGRNMEQVLLQDLTADLRKIGVEFRKGEMNEMYLQDAINRVILENASEGSIRNLEHVKKNANRYKKLDEQRAKDIETLMPSTSKRFAAKDLTPAEKTKLLEDVNKATALARDVNAKRRGMSAWDFDDTLALTKSDVLWKAPDGSTGKLNATEFAKRGSELLGKGYEFDFSEFNKVTDGKPGPFLEKALERAKKFGTKDTYILTARAPEAAPAIKKFLDSQGLKLPLKNIVGLGNSTGAAKARWMVSKFAEGYNDMYFADDAMPNVKAVKFVMDRLDVKSDVQQAKRLAAKDMSQDFNEMIERVTGIDAKKRFSEARGKMAGKDRWSRSLVVPGAQDFMGMMQNFLGKGKQGEADRAWFKKNLVNPFARATKEMNASRQAASEDLKVLYKDIPSVKRKLNEKMPGSDFTVDQAIRTYIAKINGKDMPGLSKRDTRRIVEFVEKNNDLLDFVDGLQRISKGSWPEPGNNWVSETIVSDLFKLNNKTKRAEFLQEWQQNIDIIFSPENMAKIEATQGPKFREALEDMLYRMKTGSNRPSGRNRLENAWMNWVNGSVGVTMFLNMKSALLQTISATNFMNMRENNPLAAAKAFANQKQFWKDFSYIWNSDMLKQRRAGLEYNVQEAELAAAVAGQTNKVKAAAAWLIKKGFTPTQVADSFAIASGGATYFRNRIKMYEKQGMSKAQAEAKAWLDFQELAESNQQSSRADLISQQQASTLGRTILAWGNTQMQYMRIQEKSFRDIINRRGNFLENVGTITYYGVIQSVIFSAMQNALFGYGLDEEDDLSDEDFNKSLDRTLNTVVDTQLRGFGVGGAAVSAIKNSVLEFEKQEEKAYDDSYFTQPDHTMTILQGASVSPVIGSKLRNLYSASKTWNYNRDAISEMGWDIDNPAIDASAKALQAVTNLPFDRINQKTDNLREMLDSNNQTWQRISVGLGYPAWSLGIENEEVLEAKTKAKQNKKKKKTGSSGPVSPYGGSGASQPVSPYNNP